MNVLNLQQASDYLESANVTQTIDAGHALIQIGTNALGMSFVLVNDSAGESVVSESL